MPTQSAAPRRVDAYENGMVIKNEKRRERKENKKRKENKREGRKKEGARGRDGRKERGRGREIYRENMITE